MASATSVVMNQGVLCVADSNLKPLCLIHDDSDMAESVFQTVKKQLKADPKSSLFFEDGSFIDLNVVEKIYESKSSDYILIKSDEGKLIYSLDGGEYEDVRLVLSSLTDVLIAFSNGKSLPKIDWLMLKEGESTSV
ncbi:Binding-protein-dependent transport systems inner membrane component [Moritella viscosa]|uniref:hypothetical protein n=1 Tax=Moritella viscosa TaxID=80854 RepID=UPI00091885EA|nr:hypothetical protein [Moritella viscosa]SGZ10001.1 Binding-protein-dependent transport systems inner membrane component [Moritella viscosa]